MEFKGTKEKWEVYQPNHIGCTNVKFGSEEWDGFVELWYHHSSEKEAKANALLISKAPEMLELLNRIIASEHLKGTIEESLAKQLIKEATEL